MVQIGYWGGTRVIHGVWSRLTTGVDLGWYIGTVQVFFQPETHLFFMSLSLTSCSFKTMSLGGTPPLSRNLFIHPKQLLMFIPAKKQRRGGLSVWKTLISANAGIDVCCDDEASSPCTSCTLCWGSGLWFECFAGTKFSPSVSTRLILPSLKVCF